MKVLWIVSWYPSRVDRFSGDFIKRQAEAVSLYDEVGVVYVVRDERGLVTKGELIEISKNGNLKESILYYYLPKGRFGSIFSQIRYYSRYKKAIRSHIKSEGVPALVHLQVAIKAGALALWIKKQFHVDYVLTEHWSGFLPEGRADFNKRPFYVRLLCRTVISQSKAISTVSENLGQQIKKMTNCKSFTVIPNVVNTDIFCPIPSKSLDLVRFLHVSTLDYAKNPRDILRAFAIATKSHSKIQLDIFGPEDPSLIALSCSLGLESHVVFHKEVPQQELAKVMGRSHALLLYSRYETFGCVVIEANACGLPAIVSDIPVMHETIIPFFNGIIVPGENPAALAAVIISFVEKKYQFDQKQISDFAGLRYSYDVIGDRFHEWYKQINHVV